MNLTYTPKTWVEKETRIHAEDMTRIEQGIKEVADEVNSLPNGGTASLTIGTVTTGDAAAASITEGRLNLTLPQGEKGDSGPQGEKGEVGVKGDKGETGPGITAKAKSLILELFTGAAYGNTTMQTQLDALKTEWGVSGGSGGISKKAKERMMHMDGKLIWSAAMGKSGSSSATAPDGKEA